MTENWPKISIITPSYNQGDFLEETILSVITQGYPNLEYVVIDGGSNDNSIEIIKKYEEKLTYWVSEKDNGQSSAINKGFKKLTGDIFNWLNSDDFLEKGSLFEIAKQFINNTKLDVAAFDFNEVNENSEFTAYKKGTEILTPIEKSIGHIRPLIQPATFFKMDKIRSIFPLQESLHYTMDFEMWARFILKYQNFTFIKLDDPIVNFRIHNSSKTNQHFSSDLPTDTSNKFLQEINSFFWNLSNNKYTKRTIKSFTPELKENLDYKEYHKNKSSKLMIAHFMERTGDLLYATYNLENMKFSKRLFISSFITAPSFDFKKILKLIKAIFYRIIIRIK